MKHPRRSWPLAILALFSLYALTAWAAPTKDGSSTVRFETTATGGLKIEGTTSHLMVDGNEDKIEVSVPLATLDTGLGLRNKHMREYLETDKYPNAVLVVRRSALTTPPDGGDSAGSAQGAFTLHGQTKEITFNYKARRAGDRYRVTGAASIDIRHYGIEVPSYLGVSVNPVVQIHSNFGIKM